VVCQRMVHGKVNNRGQFIAGGVQPDELLQLWGRMGDDGCNE
jgi:hypothetical protein